MELHILTFIEQCSGLQGRRRCLAAGVLDIWHGTDPPDLGTARHGTSLSKGQILDSFGCFGPSMAFLEVSFFLK